MLRACFHHKNSLNSGNALLTLRWQGPARPRIRHRLRGAITRCQGRRRPHTDACPLLRYGQVYRGRGSQIKNTVVFVLESFVFG